MRVLHGRPIAVTGSRDGTVRVWDVQRGMALRVLQGHSGSVRCLDVNGRRAVSGSYDMTARVSFIFFHLTYLTRIFWYSFGTLILAHVFTFFEAISRKYILSLLMESG
jgi:WD40 repeat protein